MISASYNHSGVSRETTRERDGILLPFFYLTYYLRYFSRLKTKLTDTDRDRSSESVVGGKWRTHDPIFSGLINRLGLRNLFSPPLIPEQV